MGLIHRRPAGVLRLGLYLPVWLYRLGLGRLLGERFLLLTHRGRKSGRTYRTVIEVIGRDREADIYYAVSGWGRKADWFRNIQHESLVEIAVGRRVTRARAGVLDDAEGALRLHEYARLHPVAFRELSWLLTGKRLEGTPRECEEFVRAAPVVAFAAVDDGAGMRSPESGDDADGKAQAEKHAQQAGSEIQEFLEVRHQRRRLFPKAALVGLCAGIASVLFRVSLAGADSFRNGLIAWSRGHPAWGWILPVTFGACGALLSVLIVRHYAPEAAGSGIPHLEAVLHRFRDLDWQRLLPVKFAGGILALGSGLALGREGPSVQMGGAVGDGVARWLKVAPRERLTLIAAGAGAGLSAAFNAPLAGLVFVLEEVRRDFRPIVFGAAFVAAATADIVARLASGQRPVFAVPSYPAAPLSALPAFALLGVAAGILGILYNRSLLASVNTFARLRGPWVLVAAAGAGAAAGTVGWFAPLLAGGGHAMSETVLVGQLGLASVLMWFATRFVLNIASYGSGAPGGIFAPLLGLGALIGLGIGTTVQHFFPAVVPQPGVFAVVGMAAYFTAIVRAPLTGIVLILEMTGNYEQMLALLVSCFAAYAVTEFFKDLPIYEALLERDLVQGEVFSHLSEPTIFEFEIEPGSLFDGRKVQDLGLPRGCILVRCSEGRREWIPTAPTRLEAHMRITAVVAPEAAHGLNLLRNGCKAGIE